MAATGLTFASLRGQRIISLLVFATSALLSSGPAISAGTAAGTVIDNTAQVTYDSSGTSISLNSNTVTITVDERIDVVVTLRSTQLLVASGDANRSLLFRVSNTGNGVEDFVLAIDSNLTGDDFDPVPAVPSIYIDSDASGDLSAGDVSYTPGSNDPQLSADGFVDILLVNDIPTTVANGDIGFSQLTATSRTGSGAPGDVFAGQGDGGSDAVIGTTGGLAAATGEYLVSDVAVNIVKSVAVADPFGGIQPVPGAILTYSIAVQVTNSGIASSSVINDPIPPNTTYVPASIRLNGAPLSDAIDADAGELDSSGAPSVIVRLGDVAQSTGVLTVTFQVTID